MHSYQINLLHYNLKSISYLLLVQAHVAKNLPFLLLSHLPLCRRYSQPVCSQPSFIEVEEVGVCRRFDVLLPRVKCLRNVDEASQLIKQLIIIQLQLTITHKCTCFCTGCHGYSSLTLITVRIEICHSIVEKTIEAA